MHGESTAEHLAPSEPGCETKECRRRKGERISRFKPINTLFDDLARSEKELAKAAARRFATGELTAPELVVESLRWEQHLEVLRTYPREREGFVVANAGIAYAEQRLDEISRSLSRLLVAGRGHLGPSNREVLEPEFTRARLADLVGLAETLGYEPRRSGRNHVMICPWHNEDTPSLVLYPPGQGWHCFGCGRGGQDAASFAAEHFQCSQVEGLRWVEELCDVPRETTLLDH